MVRHRSAPVAPSPKPTIRRSARLHNAAVRTLTKPAARVTKFPAKPKSLSPRYDCTTCGRNLAGSSFPNYLATDDCDHLINTCKKCTQEWIANQLEYIMLDKIACPECPALMQNKDVKLHANATVYERYDRLERRAIAEKTPGWRWCLNPHCRAGQVHLNVEQAAVKAPTKNASSGTPNTAAVKGREQSHQDLDICICHECGAKACVPCDRPYHSGETCTQYQARRNSEEETASLATIDKECKPCPKCKKMIQKDGGCDWLYCTQCSEQFCWACLTPYSVIHNKGHVESCVYASGGVTDPHLYYP